MYVTANSPANRPFIDRRGANDFGLTDRALRFAQLRAAYPWWTVTECARTAGYSDRARGAHVRGCELLRDARVVRAIVHFGCLELAAAQGDALVRLRLLAHGDNHLTWQDQGVINRLTLDVRLLASRTARLAQTIAGSAPNDSTDW